MVKEGFAAAVRKRLLARSTSVPADPELDR